MATCHQQVNITGQFTVNTEILCGKLIHPRVVNLDPSGLSLRPYHAPSPWKIPCLFTSTGNVFPFSLLQLPLTSCDSPISTSTKKESLIFSGTFPVPVCPPVSNARFSKQTWPYFPHQTQFWLLPHLYIPISHFQNSRCLIALIFFVFFFLNSPLLFSWNFPTVWIWCLHSCC